MEIFKAYAESYPAELDQSVVGLCLVGKRWNAVANSTPQLWTNINISFPFTGDHLDAALKRVRASGLQKLDVFINFCDPDWDGREPEYDDGYIPGGHAWVRDVMAVLGGTEGRWRRIEVASSTWVPLYELMHDWRRLTHLSSLESITMQRMNTLFGVRNVDFAPELLAGAGTLFDRNASLPKLCNLSLFGVHVDWTSASVCYQNLHKLEIASQTHDVGPTFQEFAAMLSSSPRLEFLNVNGFCPEYHTAAPPGGGPPQIPVVHLPALKVFVFGWKGVDLSCAFLRMFQIGDSLEDLTLLDADSCFGSNPDPQTGDQGWRQESQGIFEVLCELGSAVPGDGGDMSPGPFISMRGVKSLRIVWTRTARYSLIPFFATLTNLEELYLENVGGGAVEDVVLAHQ